MNNKARYAQNPFANGERTVLRAVLIQRKPTRLAHYALCFADELGHSTMCWLYRPGICTMLSDGNMANSGHIKTLGLIVRSDRLNVGRLLRVAHVQSRGARFRSGHPNWHCTIAIA